MLDKESDRQFHEFSLVLMLITVLILIGFTHFVYWRVYSYQGDTAKSLDASIGQPDLEGKPQDNEQNRREETKKIDPAEVLDTDPKTE